MIGLFIEQREEQPPPPPIQAIIPMQRGEEEAVVVEEEDHVVVEHYNGMPFLDVNDREGVIVEDDYDIIDLVPDNAIVVVRPLPIPNPERLRRVRVNAYENLGVRGMYKRYFKFYKYFNNYF